MKKLILILSLFYIFCFLFSGCSYHHAKAPDGTEIKIMRVGNQSIKDLTVYKICKDGGSFGLKLGSQQTESLSNVIKEGASIAAPFINPGVGK